MAIGIIVGIILLALTVGAFIWSFVDFDSYGNNNPKRGTIALILGIILLISFICVPFSFHTIDTGELAVVKRLGKAIYVREAGTYYDFWFTKQYVKYDTKVREITIEDMAYSSDAQQMTLNVKFQYKIMPDKALDITKTYGSLNNLETRIQAIVTEKIKAALSSYKAMDIIANRSKLSPEIETVVKEELDKEYHINVATLAITNIDFSDAFEKAVEDKMIAEQKKLKAEYEADAKIVTAEATAKANELLERSLTDKILQEMYINKWNGQLPQVVSDGNAMFQVPMQ